MAAFISRLVSLASVSSVLFQVEAELICSSTNMSVIGVDFGSSRNETGDWQHSIVLSKRGLEENNTTDIPWNVEVGYQPVHCNSPCKDFLKVKISFTSRCKRNSEYKFYPGLGYYKYHSKLTTWPVAKEACKREGAHLAIINSQQEAEALKKLVVSDSWAYIGLVKHDAKGEFVTLSGVPISKIGFARWYDGFSPDAAPPSYVGTFHGTAGTLAFCPANQIHAAICEQDL